MAPGVVTPLPRIVEPTDTEVVGTYVPAGVCVPCRAAPERIYLKDL